MESFLSSETYFKIFQLDKSQMNAKLTEIKEENKNIKINVKITHLSVKV